jgi:hypothetical protein
LKVTPRPRSEPWTSRRTVRGSSRRPESPCWLSWPIGRAGGGALRGARGTTHRGWRRSSSCPKEALEQPIVVRSHIGGATHEFTQTLPFHDEPHVWASMAELTATLKLSGRPDGRA